jgi:membrane-bound ClpP family serine protease
MIRTLVQDYEHVHTIIGVSGNLLFVVGSILFYKAFEQFYTLAVSLFVVGSIFMLIGALGNGLRRMLQRREKAVSRTDAAADTRYVLAQEAD